SPGDALLSVLIGGAVFVISALFETLGRRSGGVGAARAIAAKKKRAATIDFVFTAGMLNPGLASRKRKCFVFAVILNREDDEGSLLSSNVHDHWRDPSVRAGLAFCAVRDDTA